MEWVVEFRPGVERDLRKACDWYERQRPGLSLLFRAAIEQAVSTIARPPLSFQERSRGKRRVGVRRFPYGIFYVVRGSVISVVTVTHDARHPRTWQRRN